MKKNASLGPLICDIHGVELSQVDRDVICHPKLGGLIFFARNYESPEQLSALVRCIRELRPELILSVDQEGGRVQRFKEGFSVLPAMASLGEAYCSVDQGAAIQDAKAIGWVLAFELLTLGIDHSYAPVLDLDDEFCRAIGDRSFSKNTDVTIALAEQLILGMEEAGMAATAKHFPGHGAVSADSHHELPLDGRPFEQILNNDMQPFIALKDVYKAVMTAHILFPEIDSVPVSFSRKWLQDILRRQVGFEGLVFSDDLSMKAASNLGDIKHSAERAIKAGCDAVLVCNERLEAERTLEFLEEKALGSGEKLYLMRSSFKSENKQLEKKKYLDLKRRLGL